MPTIKAISNISHDGVDDDAGDSPEFTAKQAALLIEAGVATVGRNAIEGEVVESHSQSKRGSQQLKLKD